MNNDIIKWIEENYSDYLKDDVNLLKSNKGLDKLQSKLWKQYHKSFDI